MAPSMATGEAGPAATLVMTCCRAIWVIRARRSRPSRPG